MQCRYLQLRFSEISDKQATESIGPSGNQITLHIHVRKKYFPQANIKQNIHIYYCEG